MMIRRTTLFLLCMAGLLMPAPMPAATAAEIDLQQAAELIVQRTNKFRQQHELSAIETEDSLQQAAQKFAEFMARTDKYGHQADGQTPAQRAAEAGYEYCVVRENIAYRTDPSDLNAQQLAEHFTEGWIESPGHRENMLADFVTQTGVAVASNDGTTFYAVQLFGRPESAAYRVNVTNTTSQAWTLRIVSDGGQDETEIPPRGWLRMKRCFPITLSIPDTSAEQQVKDSADFEIQSGPQGDPQFKRAE